MIYFDNMLLLGLTGHSLYGMVGDGVGLHNFFYQILRVLFTTVLIHNNISASHLCILFYIVSLSVWVILLRRKKLYTENTYPEKFFSPKNSTLILFMF